MARTAHPRWVLSLAGMAAATPAGAQDSEGTSTECVILTAREDGTAMADWVYDASGQVLDQVEVTLPPVEGVAFQLEGRVHWGDTVVEWTQDPEPPGSAETLLLTVVLPDGAWLHDLQAVYPADLWVVVEVVDGTTAATLHREGLPHLRLLWPDGKGEPVWMDLETAATVAPQGIADEATRAAAVAGETEDEGIVEYGPPL